MSPRRRLLIATAMLVLLLAGGASWFALVEGFPLLDALYQVVITASTVGFEEVRPLDTSGRVFTMLFILLGIGIMFYVAGALVEELVAGGAAAALGRGRLNRRIRRMHDHHVICGYGRVGAAVVEELLAHGESPLVIEKDPDRLALAQAAGVTALSGDATDEAALVQAHVSAARVLIATTGSDADNTFIALTARALNRDIFIIAGSRNDSSVPHLEAAGVNRVFSPHRIAGRRIALAAVQPMLLDFVDTVSRRRPDSVTMLAELVIDGEAAPLAGQTIADVFASLRGTRVLGLERLDGGLVVGPGGEIALRRGDRLMLYGEQQEIEGLRAEPNRPGERTLQPGGGGSP